MRHTTERVCPALPGGAHLGRAAGVVVDGTETTVHVTYCPLTPDVLAAAASGRTPIGAPLPHLTVSLRESAPAARGSRG
ncbi:hypothetical protein [Streptomyces pristinaespiralis]|uniref:hypothetical protein n=1 Tax=Streptomyces pristinaespiralis TaxID=38300 RepID=UPI003404A0EB